MINQGYKLKNGVLYKKNDEKSEFLKECVVPNRIKTLEAAIEYANSDAEQCGMSFYDESQH